MFTNKYLKKYFKKYFIFILIGVITLVAVDFIQLFIPEFLGEITGIFTDAGNNGGFTEEMTKRVLQIVVYTVLVALGIMAGRVLWRLAIFHTSKHIEAGLREEMFNKAEKLPVEYYHVNTVGTVMSWFTNDVETIEEFFGWGTVMMVDGTFLSVLVVYKMLSYNVPMSILIFIPLFLIIIWGAIVEKFMSIKWENRQKAYDRLYDFAQESFTGIRVIKAFVKENQELHAFAKIAKKNKDINVSFVRISVLFDVAIEFIITIILSLLIGFGGYFVFCYVNGQPVIVFNQTINLTAGQLVTFLGYFETLIWPMIAMGQIISMHSRANTSLKRISHFLDEEEEIKDKEGAIELTDVKGEITFNHFFFTYPGGKINYLDDITLTIKAGERVGIVGKLGCGKSTLVNTLLRSYNVKPNSILVDGKDVMDVTLKSLRDNIAYVPQDNFLFSDTIKNNICFANIDDKSDRYIEAAKFSDVHGDIVDFKDGYETVSGERGVTLSGGQKQCISIARAFYKDAPILVLDDSVSAVDIKTEETILKNIYEQRKGKTTLVVASRVSTVSKLEKIIVLNEGRLEAFDTPENLLKISPTYKKMVELQKLEKEAEGGN